MEPIKTKLLLLSALAGLQITANASLLNPRQYDSGGLTWLTLAETVNLTVSDFNNGVGGWNSKYRFATDVEIAALIDSFGIQPHGLQVDHTNSINGFVFQMGGYIPGSSYNGTWFFDGSQGARGQTATAYVDVALISGHTEHPDTAECPRYFDCTYADISYTHQVTQPLSTVGLFLVEDATQPSGEVPEPASLALFGAVGLAALARRRLKDR